LIRPTGSYYETLWISSDEFENQIRLERWGSAHTSQPLGKPLHKHEGYLSVVENSIRFYDVNMNLLFAINKGSVKGIKTTYDDIFERFRDSRGFIPPLRMEFENRNLYVYTRPIWRKGSRSSKMFRGENEAISSWFAAE